MNDIETRIEILKKYTNDIIEDEFMRKELQQWLEKKSYLKIGSWKSRYNVNINIIYVILFISKLKKMKIENINWEMLCEIYNLQIYEGLRKLKGEIPEYKFSGLKKILWFIDSKDSFLGYEFYRTLIIDFYINICNNLKDKKIKNIEQIQEYKYLFDGTTLLGFSDLNKYNEFTYEAVEFYSSLPINSIPENIIQYTNIVKKSGKIVKTNYNLNGVSSEIKDMIISFLNEIYKFDDRPHKRELKKFIVLLTKSCIQNNIEKISGLDFNMLKQFMIELYKERSDDVNREKLLSNLIRFYRIIIKCHKNELNDLEKEIIKSSSITKILKENYQIVEYNPLDEIPDVNKFCFYRNINTMIGGKSTNDKMYYVDLTDMKDIYSRDIKEYIWYSSKSIKHKVGYVYQLKNFLNFKDDFYEHRNKNKNGVGDRVVKSDYLVFFKKYIEENYENLSMQASVRGEIKSFLNFHKDKYEVDQINILMTIKKPTYDGGNPIDKEDLAIIYNEFVIDAKKRNNNIFRIVFELNLYSKLRVGEILNLRRDCIFDEQSILIEGKMTGQNLKRVEVSPEVIRLIRAGIEETQDIIDQSIIGKYIFIEKRKSNFVEGIKLIDFRTKFITILEGVKEKLKDSKLGYTPYNLRDTFIDNAYNFGIKNNLNIKEICEITGNSYETCVNHYRKRDNYELYVEQLAKVNIKNVEIEGEILVKESTYNPIRENLGGCKKNDCEFELGECLMCNNFVTFTNRIDIFEKKIQEITNELNDSDYVEISQRRQLENDKLLLAKYLYNMYKLREKNDA